MNGVLKASLVTVFIFQQVAEGHFKEVYQLNINERGTSFNETIEIDDLKNTVVYRVPSHNDIKKTDVLVDYKNGHFVTRIPERGECYIKPFPIGDEQSIGETKQNMELLQHFKSRLQNTTIPVETVTTMMKVIREIPRAELSPKISEFCGDNTAYLVDEKVMSLKKGKFIVKRSTRLRFKIHNSMSDKVKKILPNGYLACNPVKDHNAELFKCLRRRKTPMVGCGLFPITCRYQATCNVAPQGQKQNPAPHNGRDINQYQWVDIECVEKHRFTVDWCCDVIPCK